jgi:hypothetical protein
MINIPFFGHVFVFSILAISMDRGMLLVVPALIVVGAGLSLTAVALRNLRHAEEREDREVAALMQFSFGWQMTAVFGGLLLLAASGMGVENALMAKSSSISHFGLFAAIQGGMAGEAAQGMIAFVFAMPFLVHPLVFFMFGRAMENDGIMPRLAVYALAIVGVAGVAASLIFAHG